MKAFKRSEFIKLPAGTIFSKSEGPDCLDIMTGLFCKTSGPDEYMNDWTEQNLIGEFGFPGGFSDGIEALAHVMELRDAGKEFELDLDCTGRDGLYNDDSEILIAWDKKDISKLRDYLNNCLDKFI